MRYLLFILTAITLSSCFSPKIVTQTKVEKQTDTLYNEVVKEIFTPIEKLVYSNCNDTAYLMTISALNRKLDSAKTPKEMRVVLRQTKNILANRDDRELKELKEQNKLAIVQLEERTNQVEQLRLMLKQKEKTNRVEARQGGNNCLWHYIIMGILTLIIICLLRIKT